MSESLKDSVIKGMFWSAVDKFGTKIISFVTNLFLARLLLPEDFGSIGMIMIFIAISNTFIESGFGSALIQKKNPSSDDYSTVFLWNLFISVVLYIILFSCAPFIATFFRIEGLEALLKVQGIVLITNSFCIIPNNYLVKHLLFNIASKINITANFFGAIVGITLAYVGWGVWSLVIRMLIISVFQGILLWIYARWKPMFVFSIQSFKELFKFGGLILLSSIFNKIYDNIQSLIIGRIFSVKDLGYYTQAKNLEQIPSDSLSVIVNQVSFPVFSKIQDDIVRLKRCVKNNLQLTTYINFPLSVFLIIVANSMFEFLFTDKWSESVPYFQILCLYSMLMSVNTTNIVAVQSVGKANYFFYSQLVKRSIGVISIFIGLQFGIMGIIWGIAVNGYLWWIIGAFYTNKCIKYGLLEQIKDVWAWFLLSVFCGYVANYVGSYVGLKCIGDILIKLFIFLGLYLLISNIFKLKPLIIYTTILKENYVKLKNRL